ncbi:hypothetical protein A9264_07465 [Vibrio sp. UCD-FRSSP16_10]|uniref:hypothetical protein n=1 Tax=Vibrio sp. UCD-FRSSP16_10 TaxID=1853257 RepID=UPI0007FEBA0E|nr:hypothetical protein [Vibrio sp. UCD-FRSSP16_10]OBT07271.1 hypothetical protein A9260_08250 [Vibrio sp. UCD-FRSSP16_30]OBT12751.1 hypothetical protein A9264_07465 [Vibrio sp. UCD-FRSSP16_10]
MRPTDTATAVTLRSVSVGYLAEPFEFNFLIENKFKKVFDTTVQNARMAVHLRGKPRKYAL